MGDLRIDKDREVRALADRMGIRSRSGLREAITDRAVETVDSWLHASRISPSSLRDVHDLVLNRVALRVERINSDDDLHSVGAKYASEMRGLPVQLSFEFESDTEALVIRRPLAAKRSASRFLAIIDARGGRRRRAWFSERHEAAHLVVPDPGARVVMRRSSAATKEPLEAVIDAVASRVGFWDPVLRPVVSDALAAAPDALTAFERVQASQCEDASAESAFRAFVQMVPEPLLLIRSSMESRVGDRDFPPRSLALRATTVILNEAAIRAGLRVWPNYRIPKRSVIHEARNRPSAAPLIGVDNLARWECETGRGLRNVAVKVAARGAWAVLQPA